MSEKRVFIFFPSCDQNSEKVPGCIDKTTNLCVCKETGCGVYFDKFSNKKWAEMKVSIENNLCNSTDNLKWVIFCHNRNSFEQISDIENEKGYETTLDYSRGDGSLYKAMWNDISRASNCCELVKTLEYWVKNYTIDPVSRIKHRSINLFHAISLDCQKLYDLAESGNMKELKSYLKSLSELWRSSRIYPTEKLKTLWYMIIGDKLENGAYVPKKKEEISLPGNMDLYSWLRKIKSDDSIINWDVWKDLMEHCQLSQESPEVFLLSNKRPGIYDYCLFLERLAKLDWDSNDGQDLCGNYIKNIEEQSKNIVEWLTRLNELFEKLITCLEKP